MFKSLRLKVRPGSESWLNEAAMEVNTVWNFCNQATLDASDRNRRTHTAKFLSGFDLSYLTAGATYEMKKIGAGTIGRVGNEYADKRRAAKKTKLSWRKSLGDSRSIGWIPFRADNLRRTEAGVRFGGKRFRLFERERLDGMQWRDGCFAEDACGDWWLCLPVEAQGETSVAQGAVGIDLGLKDTAVTSDGERLAAGQFYRGIEPKIAQAQRRGHKRQAKRLNRKAANRRKDALHKFTTSIVNRYSEIYVGDVSAPQLARTRFAKSVLDSGWGMLRTQLLYKAQQRGLTFAVVNERNTTRVCSQCGSLSGPQGLGALVVRAWTCVDCGESHDRDVNAARNIATLGARHRPPSAGMIS